LLFGLARSAPLVTNPVSDQICTELRPTPRPTYVSGRIHVLCKILRSRGQLSETETALVAEISDLQRRRFAQGCAVILERAGLTNLGRRLIEEARDAIAGAA
jgi:hypothetical protein